MTEHHNDLSFQQLSVLELLKAHIQSQKDAIATLEASKAQQNFTTINIIAAIVAALNIDSSTDRQHTRNRSE